MQRSIAWLAVGAFLLAAPIARAVEPPASGQVSKLLSDARATAFQLKEDASQMEEFTRMNVSWQSHAQALSQIRDHVNELGKETAKLKELRSAAEPWQRTAIDRMEPYLDELGAYISVAIEHVNEKKHTLAEYNDYLEATADYASDLAAMIADFVDYGRTRQRLDRLGAKLEIPPAPR